MGVVPVVLGKHCSDVNVAREVVSHDVEVDYLLLRGCLKVVGPLVIVVALLEPDVNHHVY